MLYAKLATNGAVLSFPYTTDQLREDHPNTSFPSVITASDLSGFNAVVVESTQCPPFDHTVNLKSEAINKNGKWVQEWIKIPATQLEIDYRTSVKADTVRIDRNARLASCDWTQLPDAPVDAAAWAAYRQDLRDVTAQAGFPWEVTWPEKPA